MTNDNNIKDNNTEKYLYSRIEIFGCRGYACSAVGPQLRSVGVIQPFGPLFQENKSLLDPEEGLVFCRSVKKKLARK